MEIGKAIYKILHDNIAVESMVGTRIAPNVMKQTSPFPFIVYDVSTDTPEGQKDSVALLDTATIMVSAYSKTYAEASKLANYIRTALDRVNGVYNAVNIQSIDFDGYDDVFDDMSGSDGIYRKSLNFNIRIINSFNNIYSTHFDGVDDYVALGTTGMSSVKNTGSISAWFQLETTSASGDIMRLYEDNENNIRIFYHNSNAKLYCSYTAGGTTTSAEVTDAIEGDGLWHHVSGTWDNSGTEGPELVTNGNFATDSDWTKGTGWSIANGKATSAGSNFGGQLKQTILETNKIYLLTFDIVDYTSGVLSLESLYYGETQLFSGIGSYTAYFNSSSQTELRLYSQNFNGSIDNVSVKEYTGGNAKIYLDGTLKDTTAISGTFTGSFSTAAIGNNADGGGFWKGNIDEVTIFNKELDSTEVTSLYNDGLPFNPQPLDNLKGYWKMGDGGIVGNPIATYPTIPDETGNNDGEMTNMTSTDFQADVPE